LALVNQKTTYDEAGVRLTYYYPLFGDGVSGPGDARALRSLESKGLIERIPIASYAYAITPLGKSVVESL